MIGAVYAIDQIIGRHHRFRTRFLHAQFKPLQINLTDRSFGDMHVRSVTVIFLIVAGKMLQRDPCPAETLQAVRYRRRTGTGDKRIFRIILKISAAKRIPVQIHRGRQPQFHMEALHFPAFNLTAFPAQLPVPGLGQKCGDR